MKLKKTLSAMGICVMLAATSVTAYAAEPMQASTAVTENETRIQPRVNWTGKARLGLNVYYNVTSSNNIFPDTPTITNHAGNPGKIKVRIVNSKGKIVAGPKEVAAGKSVKLGQIPAFSGTYTLQAMALSKAGSYTISID